MSKAFQQAVVTPLTPPGSAQSGGTAAPLTFWELAWLVALTSEEFAESQFTRHSSGGLVCIGGVAVASQFKRHSVALFENELADWGPVLDVELEPTILYILVLLVFIGFNRLGVAGTLTLKVMLELRGLSVEAMVCAVMEIVLRGATLLEAKVAFTGMLEAAMTP